MVTVELPCNRNQMTVLSGNHFFRRGVATISFLKIYCPKELTTFNFGLMKSDFRPSPSVAVK